MKTTARRPSASTSPGALLRRALMILVPSALALGGRREIVGWIQYREWVNGDLQAGMLSAIIFLASAVGVIAGVIAALRLLRWALGKGVVGVREGAAATFAAARRLIWSPLEAWLRAGGAYLFCLLVGVARYLAPRLALATRQACLVAIRVGHAVRAAAAWLVHRAGMAMRLLRGPLRVVGGMLVCAFGLLGRVTRRMFCLLARALGTVLRHLGRAAFAGFKCLGRTLLLVLGGLVLTAWALGTYAGRGAGYALRPLWLCIAFCVGHLNRGLCFLLRWLWFGTSLLLKCLALVVTLVVHCLWQGGVAAARVAAAAARALAPVLRYLQQGASCCFIGVAGALGFLLKLLWRGTTFAGRLVGSSLAIVLRLIGTGLAVVLGCLATALAIGLRYLGGGMAVVLRCVWRGLSVALAYLARASGFGLRLFGLGVARAVAGLFHVLYFMASCLWLGLSLALVGIGRGLAFAGGYGWRAGIVLALVLGKGFGWVVSVTVLLLAAVTRLVAVVLAAMRWGLPLVVRMCCRVAVMVLGRGARALAAAGRGAYRLAAPVAAFGLRVATFALLILLRLVGRTLGAAWATLRLCCAFAQRWLEIGAGGFGNLLALLCRGTAQAARIFWHAAGRALRPIVACLGVLACAWRPAVLAAWLTCARAVTVATKDLLVLAAIAMIIAWGLGGDAWSAASYTARQAAAVLRRARPAASDLAALIIRMLGHGRAMAGRAAPAATVGGIIAFVGVLGIAPLQRNFSAVDCQNVERMLGIGPNVAPAVSPALPTALMAGAEELSWGFWGLVSSETRRSLCLRPGTLLVGYTPEKAALFEKLVAGFNAARPPDVPPVLAVKLETADMLESGLDGKLAAISPDSDIWLAQLDRTWQQRNPQAPPLVGLTSRYAVSPIVIAMRERDARKMGYPATPLGWGDLMRRAAGDTGFKWSHPAATTASGLLATTAVFYAAAGKPSGLTSADLEAATTIEYVKAVEGTVKRYGGESEDKIVDRLLNEAGYPLDAFVAQEQLVVHYNRHTKAEKLVAIYPKEGTFLMDHPLALLEGPWVTPEQRRVFGQFAEYVASPEQQRTVMREGYRPAATTTALQGEDSPITADHNVDPAQPRALLTVPPPEMLARIRQAWQFTKRPANIYLVVDTSGSMGREKITAAKQALLSFVAQIASDREQVALVAFAKDVREVEPLRALSESRGSLERHIGELRPGGDTALYDAVLAAFQRLQQRRDPERINAVVVMTDGQDTSSKVGLEQLVSKLRAADPPVLVFTVAYGGDADTAVLRQIAEAADGQAYTSYPATIRRLYELVAQFF